MEFRCPNCGAQLSLDHLESCPACRCQITLPPEAKEGIEVARFHQALLDFTPHVWVTPLVIAANVLVFAAMLFSGVDLMQPQSDDLIDWGANYGPKTLDGQMWRIFTCMFVHFGIVHIGFNMWVLKDVGQLVERLVGNVGFILLYVCSGLLASLTSVVWNPHALSAGASGAVFGVCGAIIGFMIRRRDAIPTRIFMRMRKSMVSFVLINLAIGFIPFVDMAAHMGGLVAGVVFGLILSQPLSAEHRHRRLLRNLAALLVAGASLSVFGQILPAAPQDPGTLVANFETSLNDTMDKYNRLVLEVQAGQLTEPELATRVEAKILPDWQKVEGHLQALRSLPKLKPEGIKWIERQETIVRLRRESWEDYVQAVRTGDPAFERRYRSKWTEANVLAEQTD